MLIAQQTAFVRYKNGEGIQINPNGRLNKSKGGHLTPKGPRPFFCEKTLKTAISIAKSKKI